MQTLRRGQGVLTASIHGFLLGAALLQAPRVQLSIPASPVGFGAHPGLMTCYSESFLDFIVHNLDPDRVIYT